MMQDFTLKSYEELLKVLRTNGYSFQTLQEFIQQPEAKAVILRHDVDRKPDDSRLRSDELRRAREDG